MAKKEEIKLSLTDFMHFVNRSGTAKLTVVTNVKARSEEDEYQTYKDYWLKLREKIKQIHKKNQPLDKLDDLLEDIHRDKSTNYYEAIQGYKKFLGKRKVEWINPPHKTWTIGSIRMEVNPELGLKIKDTIYYIKLHITAKETIDKRHADLILALMEKELREKVDENSQFAVLDLKRGKLFTDSNRDPLIPILLQGEAIAFESMWKQL